MFGAFSPAWLLLGLPFVSAATIASVASLSRIAMVHHRVTWPLGTLGLAGLCAALLGLLSPALGLPVAICGGAVSGFAMFGARRDGSDGEDWRRGGPSPPEPPPDLDDDGPIDWELFDHLRAMWDASPAARR